MLVHLRVTPNIKVAGTHLDTWVLKNTGTMSHARNGTQTALSGVEALTMRTPPLYTRKKRESFSDKGSLIIN